MAVITYSIISRGSLEVIMDQKRTLISGELTLTPKFYADLSGIKNWLEPEIVPISETEKKTLIDFIIQDSVNSGTPIVFD